MSALLGSEGILYTFHEVSLPVVNWIQGIFYGIYTTLFFQYILSRFEHGIGEAFPGRVNFGVNILMYINGTVFSALSVYNMARLTEQADEILDLQLLRAILAASVLTYAQLWLGDFLIAYRTHLVWDGDWRLTALPWLILLATFVLIFTSSTSPNPAPQISAALFLAVAQNLITTSLLLYRLVSQHTESSRAGLHRFSRRNGSLVRIAYIISESAAMYLTVLLIYTVLFQIGHPAMLYLQVMLTPVTGIFLLTISVRVASMKSGSAGAGGSSMTWTPPSQWRISVQFARADLDVGSKHEESVQGDGERYIEMQHPSISGKDDDKRGSPSRRPSPSSTCPL